MDVQTRMFRHVESFLKDRTDSARVTVAVSGGADSMALLHLAQRFAANHGLLVSAVHVHHGLRAAASNDAEFVQRMCQTWGISCCVEYVDLASIPAQQSQGTEADARRLRYEALTRQAVLNRSRVVLLAHHADDQAETILWRLMRGASMTGLGGMKPERTGRGVRWLRPLLPFAKQEILQYAKASAIPFVEDETNRNLEYTRNYIRHEIMPRIHTLQPEFVKIVSQNSVVLQEEDEWIEQQGQNLVDSISRRTPFGFEVQVDALLQAPRALQRRAIKIILYCLASEEWSFAHVEAVIGLLSATHPSSSIDLPNGLAAWREYGLLLIGQRPGDRVEPARLHFKLQDGAHSEWNTQSPAGWRFFCRRWKPEAGLRTQNRFELYIPPLTEVTIRPALTSERLALLGTSGRKKIQDVFTDLKVPRHLRSNWPAFETEGKLVWLPGLARSRHFLLSAEMTHGWAITAFQTADESRDNVGPNTHGHAPDSV